MNSLEFSVTDQFHNCRIDKFLSEQIPEHSRSYLQKLLKEDMVLADGKTVKPNYKITKGETVSITFPDMKELSIEPENIPLDILYEDEDILVINKPKGMVVHPSAGHSSKTLVNALLFYCRHELSGINGVLRPGIVHRIDMDTTGSILVCKNDMAHSAIAEQLKIHSITRKYRAIVHGVIKEDAGTVCEPIGRHPVERKKMAVNYKNGKDAITHYKVLQRFRAFTYIECELETGRTHQIRVHMSSIHHPILGDMVYGPSKCPYKLQGQTLHAMVIGFTHPRTKEYIELSAPLPTYFKILLNKLN